MLMLVECVHVPTGHKIRLARELCGVRTITKYENTVSFLVRPLQLFLTSIIIWILYETINLIFQIMENKKDNLTGHEKFLNNLL